MLDVLSYKIFGTMYFSILSFVMFKIDIQFLLLIGVDYVSPFSQRIWECSMRFFFEKDMLHELDMHEYGYFSLFLPFSFELYLS